MRKIKLNEDNKKELQTKLLKRNPNQYTEQTAKVLEILENIKANGDKALFGYTKQFDRADINESNIKVTPEEIEEAYRKIPEDVLNVIRKAAANIRDYHQKKKQ